MAVVGGPLTGTQGADFLLGTAIDLGSNGIDNYANAGIDVMLGYGGDDIIVGDLYDSFSYDTEGDEIHGGDGADLIFGDTAPDLSGYGIISQWVGDPIWDTRTDGSSDTIHGEGGNDTIYGGGGYDFIYGGSGGDRIFGQSGADSLYGDQGKDTIRGGADNDQVYGGAGADKIYGEDGDDHLFGEAFGTSAGDGGDTIRGGAGNDDIRGGAGADKLYGDAGDDYIIGGGLSSDASNDLNDFCLGGSGNDHLEGNFGDDRLDGGTGGDLLTGGDGKDVFIYRSIKDSVRSNVDHITDFNTFATDKINLYRIDAIAGGANDDFIFRGHHVFTDVGQVRVYESNGNTIIDVNTTGSLAADMRIQIDGLVTLTTADFIL